MTKHHIIAAMVCGMIQLPLYPQTEAKELTDEKEDTVVYHEKYRPQYHFTPAHRWIGDPCGLVKWKGSYLAYSWGAAKSEDLVHWTELNDMAITGAPKGIATFTGSVVVDTANTSSYGRGAMLAAFTSFDHESKKQSQSIAFSHDGGISYQYYDRNPVIDIWSTEFRDPTVIWDETNGYWVMAVAKALEKKVSFYSSHDFKEWTWMSDFGPMGDNERSWECPDMFRLPTPDGGYKWVLVVSVNWAREQYFTGNFDGKEFIPDHPYAMPLYVDHGLDYYASRVFQNYDDANSPVYTLGWVNTWDYAQTAPTTYGKGIWSLPREYRLKDTPGGFRLVQLPTENLNTLRGKPEQISRKLKEGMTRLSAIGDMENCYELDATFTPAGNGDFGLQLCEGDGRRLRISYNPASECLILDRTNTTDADIPGFGRIAHCTVPMIDGRLRLNIFVDKSTVEIFANDGEVVMTALTFAGTDQSGASAFSTGAPVEMRLTAWPMAGIWE